MNVIKEMSKVWFCYFIKAIFILTLIFDALLFPGILVYTIINIVEYGWEFITLIYIGKVVGLIIVTSIITSLVTLIMLILCG